MRNIIKATLAGAFLAAAITSGAYAERSFGPLVTPAELTQAQLAQRAVVIDIRAPQTAEGFIPGAINVPYGRWRGPAENPGAPLGEEELSALLSEFAITPETAVIIVSQGNNETDFGSAARVYWTLKTAGLDNLAILNGGMVAWNAAEGRVIENSRVPRPSEVQISLRQDWTASRDEVLAAVNGETSATLIDARPKDFYEGTVAHEAAARPGTLPHARLFEHTGWFSSGPAIVNAEAAKQLVEDAGIPADQPIVSFCNTGHWAATNWFALSELAGLENVKLYPESMVGWSQAGLPMENTPGYLDNLIRSIRSLF